MLAILAAMLLAAEAAEPAFETADPEAEAAAEESELESGLTAVELRDYLRQRGHEAAIAPSPLGDDMINATVEGVRYRVLLNDCWRNRCRILRFTLSQPDRRSSLEMMNMWNRYAMAGVATLDDAGRPELQLDASMDCPNADGVFAAVRTWEDAVVKFGAYSKPAAR